MKRQRHLAGQLHTLYQLGAIGDLSDRQLLDRFATGQADQAELAFAALVERHGPMVLRVCSVFLRDPHDAQDAFQATFLVLLRKARQLWIHDSIGPWLHRVAKRLAVQVQARTGKRRAFERRAAELRTARIEHANGCDEEWTALHEEIDRLPERYRTPVVLCHLEGQSHERVASALKLPVGTLKSRLHKAALDPPNPHEASRHPDPGGPAYRRARLPTSRRERHPTPFQTFDSRGGSIRHESIRRERSDLPAHRPTRRGGSQDDVPYQNKNQRDRRAHGRLPCCWRSRRPRPDRARPKNRPD